MNAPAPVLAAREPDGGPTEAPTSPHRKRQAVSTACEACRTRRSKCDGQHPLCATCALKGTDCFYQERSAERRATVLRSQVDALEKNVGSMADLLLLLHSKPEPEAQEVLRRIRSTRDAASVLRSIQEGGWPQQSAMSSAAAAAAAAAAAVAAKAEAGPDASAIAAAPGTLVPPSAPAEAGTPTAADGSGSDASGERSESTSASALLPHLLGAMGGLPPPSVAEAAITAFFDCTGRLFHVFTRDQSAALFRAVYGPDETEDAKAALCEIGSMAAIGCQYSQERDVSALGPTFYDIANLFLEHLMESHPFRAIKACTLLAMYNVMDKWMVALSYIEVGLSLAHRYGLHTQTHPPACSHVDWLDRKKVWRTLVFLESWLSSTLGYLSGLQRLPRDELMHAMEIVHELQMEDIAQTEMAKIAVLKAEILEKVYVVEDFSLGAVELLTGSLSQWHANLPAAMHLTALFAVNITIELRRTIYFVHLLYLGAIMLLYRRIMVDLAQEGATAVGGRGLARLDGWRSQAARYAADGFLAAKQSARILGLLLEADGIFRRCWLATFQAFTTCTVVLYGIAQKQLHGYAVRDCHDDLRQAEKCLLVLAHSGQVDEVARRFHGVLQPYGSFLGTPPPSSGAESGTGTAMALDLDLDLDMDMNMNMNMNAQAAGPDRADPHLDGRDDLTHIFTRPPGYTSLHTVSHELLQLVEQPFGGHGAGGGRRAHHPHYRHHHHRDSSSSSSSSLDLAGMGAREPGTATPTSTSTSSSTPTPTMPGPEMVHPALMPAFIPSLTSPLAGPFEPRSAADWMG
ncbi:MAG: hypothetical protein M1826_004333 [Phylliscum demangeonii]|nr:MAG: hypothetical protein M1826_004333 [Phylliscum demangeonii]